MEKGRFLDLLLPHLLWSRGALAKCMFSEGGSTHSQNWACAPFVYGQNRDCFPCVAIQTAGTFLCHLCWTFFGNPCIPVGARCLEFGAVQNWNTGCAKVLVKVSGQQYPQKHPQLSEIFCCGRDSTHLYQTSFFEVHWLGCRYPYMPYQRTCYIVQMLSLLGFGTLFAGNVGIGTIHPGVD